MLVVWIVELLQVHALVGVAFGKRGAADEVEGWNGRRVALQTTLIFREGQTMIEMVAGSLGEAQGDAILPEDSESLGRHVLRGEIVDSKCFLGVMNPGNLKPHRACAAPVPRLCRACAAPVPRLCRAVHQRRNPARPVRAR